MALAKRGLLSVRQVGTYANVRADIRTDRLMSRLQAAPIGSMAWRETWEAFRHYSRGRPDLNGRFIHRSDVVGIRKAKYVARVAYRAYRPLRLDPTGTASTGSEGSRLPVGRKWAHLRTAVKTVYLSAGYPD